MKWMNLLFAALFCGLLFTGTAQAHDCKDPVEAQQNIAPDAKQNKRGIVQGCCAKKSGGTCTCSAPTLKRNCPQGYIFKKGKSCYERDNTGCCD